MRPVALLASAALSALGRGTAATSLGEPGEAAPSAVKSEPAGALARIDDALVELSPGDRAEALLRSVARDLAASLRERGVDVRRRKLLFFIGTSAGAMQTMQTAFTQREHAGRVEANVAATANYFSPLRALFEELGIPSDPSACIQVLGACASSSLAIGLACRALEAGECDLAIAGGYDALSEFVISGFAALGALSRQLPQPFRTDRDGLALGEGAALVALECAGQRDRAGPCVLGFGASADAVHVTAPDREGRGLSRAALAALSDAGIAPDAIGLVSAHGTATPYNDAAETKALQRVFGEHRFVLHPFKASIGHTLGAAGALEALAAWDALARGVLPAAFGSGTVEPELGGELLSTNRGGEALHALKLSAAFGGLNAALVLGHAQSRAGAPRELGDVQLAALGDWVTAGDAELVARLAPHATELAARADSLSELALAAVARLISSTNTALPESCAVIVGTGLATLEANERFDQRRRVGHAVLPRAFPPTSPNLCAGVCSIAFALHGPAFTLGASADGAAQEAFRVARWLVASRDVEAALVVVAEDAGPVACELTAAAGRAVPRRAARAALLLPADADFQPQMGAEPQNYAEKWASLALSARP